MVSMREIKAASRQIATRFRPARITLFGSYAYGQPTSDSDVDLLVLMHGKHVHDRALRIRDAIDFDFPIDILVRSPGEYSRRIAQGDCFLGEIHRKGRVLYEASDARVGEESRRRLQHRAARKPRKKIS